MKKIILIIITVFFISCNYKRDKLKIRNNSKIEIGFIPLMIRKSDNSYQEIAIGGIIKQGDLSYAILQKTGSLNKEISEKISSESLDKKLYLVFYPSKVTKKIHQMSGGEMITNPNFKIQKISINELNKMNWEVVYDGQAR